MMRKSLQNKPSVELHCSPQIKEKMNVSQNLVRKADNRNEVMNKIYFPTRNGHNVLSSKTNGSVRNIDSHKTYWIEKPSALSESNGTESTPYKPLRRPYKPPSEFLLQKAPAELEQFRSPFKVENLKTVVHDQKSEEKVTQPAFSKQFHIEVNNNNQELLSSIASSSQCSRNQTSLTCDKLDHTILKLAIEDPNQLSSEKLSNSVQILMEMIVKGTISLETGMRFITCIVDKEKKEAFFVSLIKTCQQLYEDRDRILRGKKTENGTFFTNFIRFLIKIYLYFKQTETKQGFKTLELKKVLLAVILKCCQACVSFPVQCLLEVECLFFVLTSIGSDLEVEFPKNMKQLLVRVRNGFLENSTSAEVRRILLQVIEMSASSWELSESSKLYYNRN